MPVHVVHWNPGRPVIPGRLGRRIPWRRPINNFGDLLGPILVDEILSRNKIADHSVTDQRLLAVGSIMKLSRPGDVVWGAGVNGKSLEVGGGADLDVRAVRGPRTQELLRSAGAEVPTVFGDPALLWSQFWPRDSYTADRSAERQEVTVVPNLHDWSSFATDPRAIDPTRPVHEVVSRIAASDFVCGSSLHGLILAESFGIPARLIQPGTEPAFKYLDYYNGTGRDDVQPASTVEEALAWGGEAAPRWDPAALLSAFPFDLWESTNGTDPR